MKTYYLLTKPGIIMGNLITTLCGFMLASRGYFDWGLFFATMCGLGAVIASACVFNNYIDRNLDKKMERTRHRALAAGVLSSKNALIFAILLGVIGIIVLALYTNWLATLIASCGFFIYVALYSFWKTHTTYATAVGSIAGATPPVVGYCAVSHQFDVGAALLLLLLVFWQMPHFFSIAMYRLADYSAASIPVLPVQRGSYVTKQRMLLYIIAFSVVTLMLSTSYIYLVAAAILSGSWIALAVRGFWVKDETKWARQMFRLSLVVMTLLCLLICVERLST